MLLVLSPVQVSNPLAGDSQEGSAPVEQESKQILGRQVSLVLLKTSAAKQVKERNLEMECFIAFKESHILLLHVGENYWCKIVQC